jgi:tetratricopeptide (TPR) repeat protein
LGDLLRACGRFPEAETAYHQARDIRLRMDQDKPDWDQARIQTSLGTLLMEGGRLEEAEAAYREALALLEKQDPKNFGSGLLDRERARAQNGLANLLWAAGRVEDAEKAYQYALKAIRNPTVDGWRSLAWFLAMCPDPRLRDLPEALRIAKLHVKDSSQKPKEWRTLGAAHYRTGNWQEAIAALEQSDDIRNSKGHASDSLSWFLLAMAHGKAGQKDQARQWYDRAVQMMEKNNPRNEELCRFRAEAAALLGVKEKKD